MRGHRTGRLVLAVTLVSGALAGCGDRATRAEPEHGAPTTDLPSFADLGVWQDPLPGDCPQYMKVFDPDAAPPPDDLADQQATASVLMSRRWETFTVEYARPTHLGLVILAAGDVEAARDSLADEGVALVAEYGAQDDLESGVDVEHEVSLVMSDQLRPVADLVRRRTRHLAGRGQIAPWLDAGAVLVQWAEPVPEAVRALETLRPQSGATVIVEGVPFSERRLMRAQDELSERLRGTTDLTLVSRCGDGSGLVVGIDPSTLGDRAPALRDEYSRVAGLPVTVVPFPSFTGS